MARINLLPWREEVRREKNKNFLMNLALVAGLAVVVSGWGYFTMQQRIDHQVNRNKYLEHEITVLYEELKEINELDSIKEKLLSRMEIIQQLQIQRPQVVHLFHELTATLPEGVHLSSIKQEHERITLEGQAVSNASVSAFMRNLDQSDWLKEPQLEAIEAKKDETINTFKLHMAQTTPTTPDNLE
ncbi:MAG: PilN domain-containing protein [Gammaproteobacteria bacterium]|nr:PilN domain-containing protein [Gammaproteobacteria bacterium]